MPPPPLVAPIISTQETGASSRNKAKMTDYLKLDAPKYKERDDRFEYVRTVKMVNDELDANDSRAIQMANFTLKCRKVKEWYKSFVEDRVDSMTCSQFVTEFTNWAFPKSSRELKVVEFE